jgi:uncharacterized coiled-coil protein SlyX
LSEQLEALAAEKQAAVASSESKLEALSAKLTAAKKEMDRLQESLQNKVQKSLDFKMSYMYVTFI